MCRAKPKLTEKQFMAQVVALARLRGFWVYHTHDSRRSARGMPDLLLARAGRPVIFAELKTDAGKTSPEQEACLELLRATGALVYLWRPGDWAEIERVLEHGGPA